MARALEATMNRNGSIHIPEAMPVILRGPKVSIFERIQRAADTLTHEIERGVNQIQNRSHAMMAEVRRDRGAVLEGLQDARHTIANAVHATQNVATRENASKVVHTASNLASHAGHYVAEHPQEVVVGAAKLGVKIAPSLAVSIGIKILGGAIAVPAIAATGVASGLNNLRTNYTSTRKLGVFSLSTALRGGLDRSELQLLNKTAKQQRIEREQRKNGIIPVVRVLESTPLPISSTDGLSIQDDKDGTDARSILRKISESRIGKVTRGYMNLEKTVVRRVVKENEHIDRVMVAVGDRTVMEVIDNMAGARLTRSQIEQMKIDAVITRMTALSHAEQAAARTLHAAASARLRTMNGIHRKGEGAAYLHTHADRQYRKQRHKALKTVTRQAMFASAGVRAIKSSITTVGMYLGLSAIHVHAANPFNNLANSMWGDIANTIQHTAKSAGDHLIEPITQVVEMVPHGNAMAAELSEVDMPKVAHTVVTEVKNTHMPDHIESVRNWTQGLEGGHTAPVAKEAHTTIAEKVVSGRKVIEHSEVLPSHPPTAVHDIDQPEVADHILSEKPNVVVPPTEYVLTGPNLTASLYNDGIIGADAKKAGLTAVQYYSQSGSAAEVLHILHQNPDILDQKSYEIMQSEVAKNPGISFGKLYNAHKDLFIGANRLKAGSTIVLDAGSTLTVSTAQEQVVETVTIDQEASLSTFLTKSGLLGEEAKKLGPSQFFSQRDTAQLFDDAVLRVNQDKIPVEAYKQAQQYLADNPHATFGEFWRANQPAFEQLDGFRKGSSFVFDHEAVNAVAIKAHNTVGAVVEQNQIPTDKIVESAQSTTVVAETIAPKTVEVPINGEISDTIPFFNGADETRDLTYNFGGGVKAKVGQALLDSTDKTRWIDPYGDNLMTCSTINDLGTVCAAHSGSVWSESKQQAINLPLENLRKWIQGDEDTFRSAPQINGFLQTIAQDNRPISVTDASGNTVAQYIFAGGKTASPLEYIDPYSEVMKSLYAKDSNLLQLCIHHQVKAWDVFENVYLQSADSKILDAYNIIHDPDAKPEVVAKALLVIKEYVARAGISPEVQEAYRVMYDQNAKLEDIDRVMPIIREFLKNTKIPHDGKAMDALILFNQYYAPAGPLDEAAQTAHGVVLKLKTVVS